MMPVSENLAKNLPYLRRYARALTGSQTSGDRYVRAVLEAALADRGLLDFISTGRVGLYSAFTRMWNEAHVDVSEDASLGLHERGAQERLSAMTPRSRQALLLTTLEDFSRGDAAQVLGCEGNEISQLIDEAVAEIDRLTETDVLIIEDEPLISMQLEDLVTDLGHTVIGTAATRAQAQQVFELKRPGLVLADIQLADGSSGIDAVEDILKFGDVPVIFITAYPEKLLTGDRPEPTYLVTKPFQEATVRAAISQALFFGSSNPL